MQKIKKLLVANRGEIVVRIIRTAKRLGISTVAIYTAVDASSLHVRSADEALLVPSYTDQNAILTVAKETKADALIPGYGFLSEDADFARLVQEAGISWVGPTPSIIEAFGVKHTARQLARESNVPIVPGSIGLLADAGAAVVVARELGFPVMLKATMGGGGMGLVVARTESELAESFQQVQARSNVLFNNDGVFMERFITNARHIEVQIFGDGHGNVWHFGERECSIQRRHQKVIEECPSPFVSSHPGLRAQLCESAVRLAKSVNYNSVGTVEFLVDDDTAELFFLEMNTRLQVEHGITELCFSVDLVELMLLQTVAERTGNTGASQYMLDINEPNGVAIEARVYSENPVNDFAPSSGLIQYVHWHDLPEARVDTWVFTGARVTRHYDPLLAKVMVRAATRDAALDGIHTMLSKSRVQGPPTNLAFLKALVLSSDFKRGYTLTSFIQSFSFSPCAISVISGGAYTLVQDLPARPAVGRGIPHAGPMDPLTFELANILAGNGRGTAALEITLIGPELRFLCAAVVALCGPGSLRATIDASDFPLWTRQFVRPGQVLKIGRLNDSGGCRAYLAIFGGLPSVADYFDSKSTSPGVELGGYQGRPLAAGDLLDIIDTIPPALTVSAIKANVCIPSNLWPAYSRDWTIKVMVGPHEDKYLIPEDVAMIYDTRWTVSHNASRSGIRLRGPVPRWARTDGGEGGAHPSNVVEYGYPIGALNWTGDEPCLFPVDAPNFGGFVSSMTIIRADWWKMGQAQPGDRVQFERVSLNDALEMRRQLDKFVDQVQDKVSSESDFAAIEALDVNVIMPSTHSRTWDKSILASRPQQGLQPAVTYRQCGDDYVLVEYGHENFDLNHRCRVTALESCLRSSTAPQWISENLVATTGCCTSLLLFYKGNALSRPRLLEYLQSLEDQLSDLTAAKLTCRRFRLPLSFESAAQREAIQRYMDTQRPHAPYLPDNLAFVARNNGITPDDLRQIYLTGTFVAVVVGFFCGNTVCLPADPRHRLNCPKMNPSRVYTPSGTVSWGGSCMSIYPVDSPGGYQMTGRTVPCFDALGWKPGFEARRPWLYQDFDLLTYYEVTEDEMENILKDYDAGLFNWTWEEVPFDMAAHNRLLTDSQPEVEAMRIKQALSQEEMTLAEYESLTRWREDKKKHQIDESTVEQLLSNDPNVNAVEAPVDANVWKIVVAEGDIVRSDSLIVILEAMKLEISVRVPSGFDGQAKVVKLLVRPGDTIEAGSRVALIKKIDTFHVEVEL